MADKLKEYIERDTPRQLYNLVEVVKDSISATSPGDTTVLDNIDSGSFLSLCQELICYLNEMEKQKMQNKEEP